MLSHRVTKRVDFAHEPTAWVEVRMPSFTILERAREAHSRKVFGMMAGVDLSQLKGLSSDEPQHSTPADGYDKDSLLRACIVAWSYDDPVTPENIAELDEQSVAAVVAVLLPAESEDARKKG